MIRTGCFNQIMQSASRTCFPGLWYCLWSGSTLCAYMSRGTLEKRFPTRFCSTKELRQLGLGKTLQDRSHRNLVRVAMTISRHYTWKNEPNMLLHSNFSFFGNLHYLLLFEKIIYSVKFQKKKKCFTSIIYALLGVKNVFTSFIRWPYLNGH